MIANKISRLLLGLSLSLLTLPARANPVTGTVDKVIDGDTFQAKYQNKNITIQLACIDSPDYEKFDWQNSRDRLSQLLPVGSTVEFTPVSQTKTGRIVAIVSARDNNNHNYNVNLKMVAEGRSIVFQRYLNNCSSISQSLLSAEANAKKKRLGVWQR